MISALARNESSLSSDFWRHLYKALSADSYFFSRSIWPQWPPRISMIRWIDLRSLSINSDWCSCNFWKAEPTQLRINLVASSVLLQRLSHFTANRFPRHTQCKSLILFCGSLQPYATSSLANRERFWIWLEDSRNHFFAPAEGLRAKYKMVTPRKLCVHCNSGVDSAKGMDLHIYLRGTHALKFKRFLSMRNVSYFLTVSLILSLKQGLSPEARFPAQKLLCKRQSCSKFPATFVKPVTLL